MIYNNFETWFSNYSRQRAVCDDEKQMLQAAFEAGQQARGAAHGDSILIVGNPVDGLKFIGPFPDPSDANEYADVTHRHDSWWCAHLAAPPTEPKTRLAPVVIETLLHAFYSSKPPGDSLAIRKAIRRLSGYGWIQRDPENPACIETTPVGAAKVEELLHALEVPE